MAEPYIGASGRIYSCWDDASYPGVRPAEDNLKYFSGGLKPPCLF
ncbi:MAG: hypothetical protein ABH919_03150 [bacterium]